MSGVMETLQSLRSCLLDSCFHLSYLSVCNCISLQQKKCLLLECATPQTYTMNNNIFFYPSYSRMNYS